MKADSDDLGMSTHSVDKILNAAELEFSLHGRDSVKIQAIADRAGVSRQLIYHYFTTKENLYVESLIRMANRFFEKRPIARLNSDDPVQTIYKFAYDYCGYYETYPQTGRLILDQVVLGGGQIKRDSRAEARRETLFVELRAALHAAAEMGLARRDISAEGIFFHTLVLTLGYTTIAGLLGNFHLDVPELGGRPDLKRHVAELVVASIRPPA